MSAIRKLLGILSAGLLVASCTGHQGHMGGPFGPSMMYGNPTTGMGSASNGERIYFTATSNSGAPISYVGGLPGVGNMRMACVVCHGPEGHGGSSAMMGVLVQAPNITWPALSTSDPPYTSEDMVKAAITQGVDPSGQPLNAPMPLWSMTASDLNDLVVYLKTLR